MRLRLRATQTAPSSKRMSGSSFVEETQGASRVTAILRDVTAPVGRFTGLVARKLGARILGSPFPGWSTAYMGFNLEPGVDRREAVAGTWRGSPSRSLDVRTTNSWTGASRSKKRKASDIDSECSGGFEIDLTQDEDSLYAGMDRNRHRAIAKSQRRGVEIEEATDESFADEYYSQLLEGFGSRVWGPGRDDADRVPVLIRHLQPTGRLLLLRAREPDGRCTSTGIYLGFGGVMYSWGAASYSSLDVRHSNEALLWHAMRHLEVPGVWQSSTWEAGEITRDDTAVAKSPSPGSGNPSIRGLEDLRRPPGRHSPSSNA